MTVLESLDCIETTLDDLRALARRHERYGVHEGHYASVGATLVWTLEQARFRFHARCTAWVNAYGLLSSAMIAASS